MAIVEVTVVPLGTGSTGISEYVAGCHQVLAKEQGIKFQLTPMGTILEGDLDVILAVIRRMHEVPFQKGGQRVLTSIKIDDRRDKVGTMEAKLKSVLTKIE